MLRWLKWPELVLSLPWDWRCIGCSLYMETRALEAHVGCEGPVLGLTVQLPVPSWLKRWPSYRRSSYRATALYRSILCCEGKSILLRNMTDILPLWSQRGWYSFLQKKLCSSSPPCLFAVRACGLPWRFLPLAAWPVLSPSGDLRGRDNPGYEKSG